jgi:hypothetical protein
MMILRCSPSASRPAPCPRGWRALVAACALAAGGGLARAQAQPASEPWVVVPAEMRLGIEKVTLPGKEKMGLVGTTYLLELGHGFSGGPAAYGAISGRRGGLFTVGAELAWRHRLADPLDLDLGYYVGGGGGGSAPVGGGLMLRPHADLLWDFGPYRAGVSWSQVRFANGDISSRQLGLVWSAKTDFRYVPRDRIGESVDPSGRSGMGFDRLHAVFGVYKPRSGAMRISGGPLSSTIGLVGARVERAIDDHAYWGLEASGAAHGGVAGYAEYLGTLGTETTFWPDVLTLGARLALGMGGGGDVDVGGGLLAKDGVYGTFRVTRELGLTLEGGYTRAPQGTFRAVHAAASLNWILDDPTAITAPARTTRTEWLGGIERYDALRRDGSTRPLESVVLKVHRFVSPHVYLSGQVHSGYGGGAGGYTSGLFGVGTQWPVAGRFHVGADALIGAAGGGGVETHGGAIVKPNVYVGANLGPSSAVRIGTGRIRSLRTGGLDSSTVDLTFAFTFGVPGHGYQ